MSMCSSFLQPPRGRDRPHAPYIDIDLHTSVFRWMGDSEVEGAGGGASAGDSAGNTLCADFCAAEDAANGVASAPAVLATS